MAVVAYSFTYPMGVMGAIIAILILERLFKIDYNKERELLSQNYSVSQDLTSATIEVTNPEIAGHSKRDLFAKYKWNVVFGRYATEGKDINLPNWDTCFEVGDQIMVVGPKDEIEAVANVMGSYADSKLSYDRSTYDVRRIFVSNPYVVGKSLSL